MVKRGMTMRYCPQRTAARAAGLVLITLFFAALVGPGAAQAQPKLKVDAPTAELGELLAGSSISYDFIVRNEGKEPLLIKQVGSSCGCASGGYDPIIEPGGSGKVSLKVDISPLWAGRRLRQSLLVETNDPKTPFLTLTLTAPIASSSAAPSPESLKDSAAPDSSAKKPAAAAPAEKKSQPETSTPADQKAQPETSAPADQKAQPETSAPAEAAAEES